MIKNYLFQIVLNIPLIVMIKNFMIQIHIHALKIVLKFQKNIIMDMSVLNLVINIIILENLNALMNVEKAILNIFQLKKKYAIMIVKTFHLFFIMIKIEKNAFLNVTNILSKKRKKEQMLILCIA